jgi:putative FmdB family regulatory protein
MAGSLRLRKARGRLSERLGQRARTETWIMPTYEYICEGCRHEWSTVMTMNQHLKNIKPVCPKCRSKKVHQKVSSFAAVTSKKA